MDAQAGKEGRMMCFCWEMAAHGTRLNCPRPGQSVQGGRPVVQECREAEAKCQLLGAAAAPFGPGRKGYGGASASPPAALWRETPRPADSLYLPQQRRRGGGASTQPLRTRRAAAAGQGRAHRPSGAAPTCGCTGVAPEPSGGLQDPGAGAASRRCLRPLRLRPVRWGAMAIS